MTASAPEADAGHVERAIAGITDRQGAIRATTGVHAAKACRASDGKPARRRGSGDVDAQGTSRIVADYRDRRGFGAETHGLKADGHWQSIPGPYCDWEV